MKFARIFPDSDFLENAEKRCNALKFLDFTRFHDYTRDSFNFRCSFQFNFHRAVPPGPTERPPDGIADWERLMSAIGRQDEV